MSLLILPRPQQLKLVESFNATTSIVDMGVCPEQWLGAQTVCAVVFPVGAGEVSTNTIFSVNSAANVNDGQRFRLGDAAGAQIFFNANSTGTAGAPLRTGTDVLTYSVWHFIAATWDGTLTATGIRLFYARQSGSLIECAYGTTTNGTTALAPGVGKLFALFNRPDAGRTFNGDGAYVARWEGVKPPQEIERICRMGPLSFPGGQILAYANGVDYGPYHRRGVKSAVTQKIAAINGFPLGSLPRMRIPYEETVGANAQPPRSMHQFRQRAA